MKRLAPIILVLLCIGCSSNDDEAVPVPDDLLSRDKMIEVMTDVQMAESLIRNNRHNVDSIKPEAFYDDVWKKHSISADVLERSLTYYATNPDTLESFYEEVINILTKRQAEVESEMEAHNEG